MARFRPQTPALAAVNSERYIIVPCEADGCADLAVIWDRLEEQVVDVISAASAMRFFSTTRGACSTSSCARRCWRCWRASAGSSTRRCATCATGGSTSTRSNGTATPPITMRQAVGRCRRAAIIRPAAADLPDLHRPASI